MPLFIVSVPIGNPDDITIRATKVLKEADVVICEEFKVGQKLLKRLGIDAELMTLNEHNEKDNADEVIQELLLEKRVALFSDAGTPLFADPGTFLVQRCHNLGIKVIPVPGASSLTAALSVAGVNLKSFHFAGFLPRQTVERQKSLSQLSSFDCPVIIMDTPYRLKALVDDIKEVMGGGARVTIALSMTQPGEAVLKGTVSQIIQDIKKLDKKREFVLILEPKISRNPSKRRSRQPRRHT